VGTFQNKPGARLLGAGNWRTHIPWRKLGTVGEELSRVGSRVRGCMNHFRKPPRRMRETKYKQATMLAAPKTR